MATDEQVEKQSHPLLTPELRLQILALLASEPQPKATMTYDEFLAWANEDTLAEWVDGRVVLASPVGLRHQEIVNFLVGVLSGFARLHGLGRVLNGSFQMKLAHSGREPDVLFVGADHSTASRRPILTGRPTSSSRSSRLRASAATEEISSPNTNRRVFQNTGYSIPMPSEPSSISSTQAVTISQSPLTPTTSIARGRYPASGSTPIGFGRIPSRLSRRRCSLSPVMPTPARCSIVFVARASSRLNRRRLRKCRTDDQLMCERG